MEKTKAQSQSISRQGELTGADEAACRGAQKAIAWETISGTYRQHRNHLQNLDKSFGQH
jgi:hypothetical protein